MSGRFHQLHTRIPETLWEQLQLQAQAEHTTVTELANQLLRMGLEIKQQAASGGKITVQHGEATKELVLV